MANNNSNNNNGFYNNNNNNGFQPDEDLVDEVVEILRNITNTLRNNGFGNQQIINVLAQIERFVGQDNFIANEEERENPDDLVLTNLPQIIQDDVEELYGYWYPLQGQAHVQHQVNIFRVMFQMQNPPEEVVENARNNGNVNEDPQPAQGGRRKHKKTKSKTKHHKKSRKTKKHKSKRRCV